MGFISFCLTETDKKKKAQATDLELNIFIQIFFFLNGNCKTRRSRRGQQWFVTYLPWTLNLYNSGNKLDICSYLLYILRLRRVKFFFSFLISNPAEYTWWDWINHGVTRSLMSQMKARGTSFIFCWYTLSNLSFCATVKWFFQSPTVPVQS